MYERVYRRTELRFKSTMTQFLVSLSLHLTVAMEVSDENTQRFTVELEFVQCLANPDYLNCK